MFEAMGAMSTHDHTKRTQDMLKYGLKWSTGKLREFPMNFREFPMKLRELFSGHFPAKCLCFGFCYPEPLQLPRYQGLPFTWDPQGSAAP